MSFSSSASRKSSVTGSWNLAVYIKKFRQLVCGTIIYSRLVMTTKQNNWTIHISYWSSVCNADIFGDPKRELIIDTLICWGHRLLKVLIILILWLFSSVANMCMWSLQEEHDSGRSMRNILLCLKNITRDTHDWDILEQERISQPNNTNKISEVIKANIVSAYAMLTSG